MRRAAVVAVVGIVVLGNLALGVPDARGADERPTYTAPVPGPVIDGWRPPSTRYGPGNRGLDFATVPGEPVHASADGEVTFAGQVGGTLHVVVLHDDGVRTSYSFLASVAVRRGDHVSSGDEVGTAARSVHFGVRVGDDYVDPATLLGRASRVHLVRDDLRRPLTVFQEAAALLRGLGTAVRAGADGVVWAVRESLDTAAEVASIAASAPEVARAEVERLATLLELAGYYDRASELRRVVTGVARLRRSQAGCTPAAVAAGPLGGRRIAVLVSGFGSTSREPGVGRLDTGALGYADRDVAVFSYRGGQVPGRRHVPGIEASHYDAPDSTGDLDVAGRRLRALLATLRYRNRGVPIDVIAYSQGGLVARAAIGGTDPRDPRAPAVAHLVTIGTPYDGANLATGVAGLRLSTSGSLVAAGAERLGAPAAGTSAVAQMAHGSDFLDGLARRPLDAATRVTSIATAGDLVVPALSSSAEDAVNVLLPGRPSPGAHRRLPGQASVAREVALALGDRGPTCRSVWAPAAQAAAIGVEEDLALAGLTVGGLYLDRRVGGRPGHPPAVPRDPVPPS